MIRESRKMAGPDDQNLHASLRTARVLNPNIAADGYERTFYEAVEKSKDVTLARMHHDDRQLLNKNLHEKPQLMTTSNRFNYVRLAELFDIPRDDIHVMSSAEDVLDYIDARKETVYTVADLLQKLKNSSQCFDVVRKLSQQIVERYRNTMAC